MKNYLKRYCLELEVVGPVYVGSGKEISKKEYIFFSRQQVAVFDISKLYEYFKKKDLVSKFEVFMMDGNRKSLENWLREVNIGFQEISSCVRYRLAAGDLEIEKNARLSIMECMKDAYGSPFVPGTTLKGLLRTLLLYRDVYEHRERYRELAGKTRQGLEDRCNRNLYLKKQISGIEAKAFRTLGREGTRAADAVNDGLSGLIISDSVPIEMKDVVLCQRVECHMDGSEKKLNVARECIRPGTKLQFSLTIDESKCAYTVKDIKEAVSLFSNQYYERYLRKYSGTDRPGENHVWLGGGTGFATKTVVYSLFDEKTAVDTIVKIFEKTGVPSNHKHWRDKQAGVSPHILKSTRYQGKRLQMGMCRMNLKPFSPDA